MIQDRLDSEDFYNLMQCYRHEPGMVPAKTVEAFESVKSFIRFELQAAYSAGYSDALADCDEVDH